MMRRWRWRWGNKQVLVLYNEILTSFEDSFGIYIYRMDLVRIKILADHSKELITNCSASLS
jgi:hypothetical protein